MGGPVREGGDTSFGRGGPAAPYAAWLEAAIAQAEASWEQGGIPIGAVLVDADGRIVAAGHNRRVQDGDPTAHAEVTCIRRAGRRRDWSRLTLVSTLSPCIMCAGTAILLRIGRVIAGEHRTFVGAEDLLRARGVDLVVLDDRRCIDLMQRLQREKPDLWAEDIGG
ncbi:MAG: nucleoside deaminase [Phycisphaeraceae bacterium]|nr:nucleoside deaminase [Phycisphaeraceae bacterium]